jgi:nitroreductase
MTRTFTTEPVDVGAVTEMLDVCRRAPSAGFSQGTHFLLLDGPDVANFWEHSGAGPWFADRQPGVLAAPIVILPLADPTAYSLRYSQPDKRGHGLNDEAGWPVPFWFADAAMAVQNLLLLVEAAGLGALYFGLFGDERSSLDPFGVPAHIRALGAVAVGHRHPDDRPTGSPTRVARRPRNQVIHVGSWSSPD